MSPLEIWKHRAEKLWQLLDDIDTADDAAKGNDGTYRQIVQRLQRQRCQYAESHDGYTLTWKELE